jgi:hypothetical protein
MMPRATRSQSSISKEVFPDDPCEPWVEIVGDLKGKVEQVNLFDLGLTYQILFPQMNINVLWYLNLDEMVGM